MRRIAVAAMAVLAACGGGGEAAPAAAATTVPTTTTIVSHLVTGTFLLRQEGSTLGSTCAGRDGFDDIKANSQVTVKDEAGTVLAVGSLGSGTGVVGDKPGSVYCRWRFSISGVPDRPFYQFETGRRGVVTFSRADMETKGWSVALTLGP
jgi:hypothetical protein